MRMKLQLSWFTIALIVNGILVSSSFGAVHDDKAFVTTGEHVACFDRTVCAINSRRRHELEMFIKETATKLRGPVPDSKTLKAN